jgi:heat shock protein HtpX
MGGTFRVFVLMAGLTALFVAIGGAIGGQTGMLAAFGIAAAMNLFAYFNSARAALRAYRAQLVTPEQAPELYAMVDRLRQRAGLPMPALAVAPHAQPNAFATGRNPEHAVVCVTEGIVKALEPEELEGVLAHELAHIKNGDMLLQTVAATLSGAIGMVSRMGLFTPAGDGRRRANPLALIFAPLAAMALQFAISRTREFKADATGAQISGRPLALASALGKIDQLARRVPMAIPPNVAPLAQVDPLQAVGGGLTRLFATHPPIAERIARLQAMAAAGPAVSA